MKLWLDDCRVAPPGWTRANNMAEAIDLCEKNVVEEMSLDHDLGPMPICATCELSQAYDDGDDRCDGGQDCRCGCHRELQPTGYDFVKWMVETGKWPSTRPGVHSQNPVGKKNMEALIDRYWFNPRIN